MIRRLLLAAALALVAGPAFTLARAERAAHVAARPTGGLGLGAVAAVRLEPLLPSGLF